MLVLDPASRSHELVVADAAVVAVVVVAVAVVVAVVVVDSIVDSSPSADE